MPRQTLKNYENNSTFDVLLFFFIKTIKYSVNCIDNYGVEVYLAANVAAKVSRDMRKDMYKKVELFSNAEFDKFSTASLITHTTNDINKEVTRLFRCTTGIARQT